MSGKTKIQWAQNEDGSQGATWNPVRGCSRISPGCENCYAERTAARFSGPGKPFEGFVQITNGHPQWTGKVGPVDHMMDIPLHTRKPTTYFVNSMSDLFHKDLTLTDVERVFRVMLSAPQHRYQILTKRADVMEQRVPVVMNRIFGMHWKMPDFIWLGVSVENQKYADERIPHLLRTPAAIRFVSYEPAIGAVEFEHNWLTRGHRVDCEPLATLPIDASRFDTWGIDWIIVGGESGPGARPFNIEWARSTVAQCKVAGVACFVKQIGAHPYPGDLGSGRMPDMALKDRKGGDVSEWPADIRVRQMPEVAHA